MTSRSISPEEAQTAELSVAISQPPLALGRKLLRSGSWLTTVASLLFVGDVTAVLGVLALIGAGRANVLTALSLPLVYRCIGLYRPRISLSILEDLPMLVVGGLVPIGAASAVGDAFDEQPSLRAAAAAAVTVIGLRGLVYAFVRLARRRRWVHHRTVVVGAGLVGQQIVDVLTTHPEYGLEPVGFVDDAPAIGVASNLPVLGDVSQLVETARRLRIRVVVVAFGTYRDPDLVSLLRASDRLDCDFFFVPRLYELGCYPSRLDHLWSIPVVRLRRTGMQTGPRLIKRLLDIFVALLGLALLAPVLLLVALAVRLEGGSGVLFRQERVGLGGKTFTLLKFRSLCPQDEIESQTRWSVINDPRVGPVGRFIRGTSLDELPQLWNVLKGDMSLVGPRPERPEFVSEFTARYAHYTARHRMPVGLTGWAQVNGLRGDTSIDDRARFDNAYIEGWSLWMDVKVSLRTLSQVVRRAGG